MGHLLESRPVSDTQGICKQAPTMPNQENPNIKFLNVRVTQELFRKAEKRAKERDMDVSELVRFLVNEDCAGIDLSPEDYIEIARRVQSRREKLNGNV